MHERRNDAFEPRCQPEQFIENRIDAITVRASGKRIERNADADHEIVNPAIRQVIREVLSEQGHDVRIVFPENESEREYEAANDDRRPLQFQIVEDVFRRIHLAFRREVSNSEDVHQIPEPIEQPKKMRVNVSNIYLRKRWGWDLHE